ncbi:MAG: divalent metal cation transporter [Proteobacteria bacterium]|nr:divalent metal cation transporter [Pseudomonadota bacterium]
MAPAAVPPCRVAPLRSGRQHLPLFCGPSLRHPRGCLKHNAAHLGIVTGYCISEAATRHLKPWVSRTVLSSAVLAAAATAMAEILGAVIARQLKYEFLDTLFSMIVGQNPLDTQDPSSYTLTAKKEVLINASAAFPPASVWRRPTRLNSPMRSGNSWGSIPTSPKHEGYR